RLANFCRDTLAELIRKRREWKGWVLLAAVCAFDGFGHKFSLINTTYQSSRTYCACAALIAAILSSSFGLNKPIGRTSRWRRIPFASITKTARATRPGINDRAL